MKKNLFISAMVLAGPILTVACSSDDVTGVDFGDQVSIALDDEIYHAATAEELIEALTHAKNGSVVVVNEDIDLSESVSVKITSDIKLEIPDGKTITTTCKLGSIPGITVADGASVTIEGGGTIAGNQKIFAVDGELTIENVNLITSEKFAGAAVQVNEGGKLKVEEGAFIAAARSAICIEGDAVFNGGHITSTSVTATNSSGTKVAGEYCVLVANKKANVVINDGYFQGAHGVIDVGGGKLTINEGIFASLKNAEATDDNYYALCVENEGGDGKSNECEVTVNGGYFFRENTAGCFYHASGNENSKLIIQGGTFQNQGAEGGNAHVVPNGSQWQSLEKPETIEVNGVTTILTFNYSVTKISAE